MSLAPPAFKPLPLGAVRPNGWLLRQLRIQADGLSGHLDEFWPDVAQSQWFGGTAEGWERAPYWLDGAIPLEQVEEISKQHPDVEVHVYEGAQHGFSCDARGSFHPLSAAIALGRTLEFFVANGVKP